MRPGTVARVSRLVALAAVALAVLIAGSAVAAAPGTRIVRFNPFDMSGSGGGIAVGRTFSGSCFSGSIAMPRPDAWRCSVGNEIYDPCLTAPIGPAPLICVAGRTAIRLKLVKALPRSRRNPDTGRFSAWRLTLRNGDVCDRLTGTTVAIEGRSLAYGCRSGGSITAPLRGHPFWTARYLPKGADASTVERLARLRIAQVVRALG
jgi:hypothetical protein